MGSFASPQKKEKGGRRNLKLGKGRASPNRERGENDRSLWERELGGGRRRCRRRLRRGKGEVPKKLSVDRGGSLFAHTKEGLGVTRKREEFSFFLGSLSLVSRGRGEEGTRGDPSREEGACFYLANRRAEGKHDGRKESTTFWKHTNLWKRRKHHWRKGYEEGGGLWG